LNGNLRRARLDPIVPTTTTEMTHVIRLTMICKNESEFAIVSLQYLNYF
jgi:hypothetical protein